MKAKKSMYAKGGKNDPKKKKKKKKDVKGRDVSVGGNIDYNKPNKKTGFAGSSDDRETAKKMLSSQLKDAGVLGAERTKAYQKKKLTQRGDKFTASTEVSSPMDVKMYGGKVKAVKKYKNGGKNGDPKKKKSTGATTTSPISAGAKADIKKTFTTSADKAKEKDFADSVRGKLEGVLYRAGEKKTGDDYIDAKYKRKKEKKEPIRIGNIKVNYKGDKRGRPTAQDDTTSRQFERSKEKYEKELKAAKTPEEKQRVKDKYYSKKTQDLDKQAREYKSGGKMKVKKYKKGGKVKDKLKALAKKK